MKHTQLPLLRKKEKQLGVINSQEFQNEIIIIMAKMIFQFIKLKLLNIRRFQMQFVKDQRITDALRTLWK